MPLAMIAGRFLLAPSFCQRGQLQKEYLEQAISNGLGFYVSEKDYEVGIPAILVNDIKQAMSLIAMEFYGHPENN